MNPRQQIADLFRDPAAARMMADAERARRSGSHKFSAFVKQAWHVVEQAPLVWNWHLDDMCAHLEAVRRGEIKRLLVNVPPRSAKSTLFSILFPAWVWLAQDAAQFLYLSYSERLSTEHSGKCRQAVESEWYRQQYHPRWSIREDQNAKHDFLLTSGGRRRATSIGGGVLGYGCDYLMIDDPLDAREAHSLSARETARSVVAQAAATRLNDPQTGRVVLVMQRLCEGDPSDWAKRAGYEHYCVPSEFDPARRARTYHLVNGVKEPFWQDPREAEGELLFPARFPREVLDDVRRTLGTAAYMAQHQQRPVATADGALWRPEWVKRWLGALPDLSRVVVAVDPSGSAKQDADEAGIVVAGIATCDCLVADGGKVEEHAFVLADRSGRYSPDDMARKAVGAYHEFAADRLVAEDNFGGAIIRDLVRLVDHTVCYKRVHASRGKVVRAEPIAALYEAGRVHHVGAFGRLEEELTTYAPGASYSPGRMDALVWAITDLLVGEPAASFSGLLPFRAPRRAF